MYEDSAGSIHPLFCLKTWQIEVWLAPYVLAAVLHIFFAKKYADMKGICGADEKTGGRDRNSI